VAIAVEVDAVVAVDVAADIVVVVAGAGGEISCDCGMDGSSVIFACSAADGEGSIGGITPSIVVVVVIADEVDSGCAG
jgi:hypothetical protein